MNRIKGRGGGLVIVYNSDLDVKLLISSKRNSFQFIIWRFEIENRTITIAWLYHPPPLNRFVHTNNQFIDDFLDFYGSISAEYKNIMIFRNFNAHVKDNDNEDGLQFPDMTEALGLNTMGTFLTHTKGNILHLVLIDAVCDFNSTSVNQGQFLSDLCSVITSLDYLKLKINWISKLRKWKVIAIDDFIINLHIEEL